MFGHYLKCAKEQPPTEDPKLSIKPFCTDETGMKFRNRQNWVSDNCTKKNVCYFGVIHTEPLACPKNGICKGEYDQLRCGCQKGFRLVGGKWCVKI
ncbi:hypothetical protein L596_021814 [Steinernema carpocapsae]|uniref:TILa domain-containing protein n=1 Tax=Steinernema carpocapsae TaxID=34508 RepID=A0A4U5MJX5_STECR|nr:hypothetical protein L596_021814 [Steinernema carpocapsae]